MEKIIAKEEFINLINTLCNAEDSLDGIDKLLDNDISISHNINIRDFRFYNEFTFIIFKLFEKLYGYEASQLIESYLYDDVLYTGILSHEECYEKLQKLIK